ncbi:MAG: MXAN_5808 family serine peptidase, partial [Myxococcales bacterium]
MTSIHRTRGTLLRRGSILGLLVLLWAFAASDRTPASLSNAAFAAQSDQRGKKDDKPDHDLSALKIFNRVVILIKDNYVDPKRVEPRKMLVNALDQVEMRVAEIMVEGDEKSPKIKLTVGKTSKEFDVTGVDSLWRMSFALKEVFDFINKNLTERDETREIEYAAVNGMLKTLDPHSVLLSPDYFKEMKLQTKGEFGGLGFVIQMKEGNLTVVKVLKGTPAYKAGIKNKDQILKINAESTVNMDLNEAVARLRGKPDSEVTISLNRQGFPKPKDLTLKRAIINVESVESKLLSNNVGYIKLKGFQGNTARDMHAQIKALREEAGKNAAEGSKLKGLVLDLRNNPGGLLDQAIQISDAFIDSGTLVTTVGYSDKLREVKKAHPDETERELPIVVIVNSGSASASEIVSGALKNHDRAVVIGRQTFGKGSVQVLYDFPDDSALKLTIAQYLTPGDISIQEVGITPDIQLIPSRVAKDRIDVFAPKKIMGEADLDKHLGNPNGDKVASKRDEVVQREKPLEELRYLRELTAAEKREEKAAGDDLAALEELEEA